MNTLSDLINLVNKKRLSKIDVLDKTFLNGKSENLYYKLYNAIETKQIKNDDEAAQFVYGTSKSDPRYKMLKSRLKDKVLKSVLLLDVDDTFNSETTKAYYECITFNLQIEILIKINGTTKLIHDLIKENHYAAHKHKFYDILKNLSYYLMSYYTIIGDDKLFVIEEKKYLHYIDLAQKEQIARSLYFRTAIMFQNNKPINEFILKNVESNLNLLYKLKDELKIIDIDFYYIFLALEFYYNSSNIIKLFEICDAADDLINKNLNNVPKLRKNIILIYRIKGLFFLKRYNPAINLITSLPVFLKNDNYTNWLRLKELEFKLFLNTNDQSSALNTYETVKNKSSDLIVDKRIEKWKIYHAYLIFMDNYLNKGDYKFNLARFLNDVPVNSKDKSGFNFAIRVIEIFFYAARKQYNLVFAKMEGLRVYRSRYLNDNTYKRNHLFLSLLLKAEKSGFDSKIMKEADWKEVELLKGRNNFIADWEIIPYETLWDIFVELAKK